MNKTILVTGATGLIGKRIAKALLERGDEIILLTTNSQSARQKFPSAKKIVEWKNYSSLQNEKIDAVINLAGTNPDAKRWNESFKKEIHDSRINTTKKIVELINSMKPKPDVLVNSSGVDYYPNLGEQEVTEETQPDNSFMANIVKDWEAEAMKADCRVICVRTGFVVAKESKAIKKMSLPFKLFVGAPVAPGSQYMPWIHIEDMVGIFLFSVDNPKVSGAVNAVSSNPVSNKNFSKTIAKILHRPCWFTVPAFMLKILFGEIAVLITNGRKAMPKKILEYGYKFKYDNVYDALKEALK